MSISVCTKLVNLELFCTSLKQIARNCFFSTNNLLILWEKQGIEQSWKRPHKFDICFCEILNANTKSLFEGETEHQTMPSPSFEIFLIFHNSKILSLVVGQFVWQLVHKVFVLDIEFRFTNYSITNQIVIKKKIRKKKRF